MPSPANPRYTRLHHAYWLTPGLDGLSPRGETTWTRALAYADQNLTDGHISRAGLKMINRTPRDAAALVAAGLWSETSDGWQINDYDQWATPAAKISKQRAGNAQRQARHRARNALRENGNRPETERVSSDLRHDTVMTSAQSGTPSTHDSATQGGIHAGQDTAPEDSNALRNALRNGHQPDQTRPDSGGVGSNRQGPSITTATTGGAGAPGMDRSPADHGLCPTHGDQDPGTNCHGCRVAREQRQAAETTATTARRAALDACLWCDAYGWRVDPDTGDTIVPTIRCDHTPLPDHLDAPELHPTAEDTTPPATPTHTSAPGSVPTTTRRGRRPRVPEEVRAAIRADVAAGRGTTREIAARYGVAQSTVSRLASALPANESREPVT